MRFLIFALALLVLLPSCEEAPEVPELKLKPASFRDLPGWPEQEISALAPAFRKSCARILRAPSARPFGPLEQAGTYGDWQPLCAAFEALPAGNPQALQTFFEANFTPYQVLAGKEATGLFTGYYESSLHGSRTQQGPYQYPLYKRPDDLVMVHLGQFREDLKGRRIAGRVINGTLKPYEAREEIVNGDWPHNDEVLLWVDNPIDAFFVQIQGSGLVELDDGTLMRIGYAGQNGHPYYAIGRELIKREHLTKEDVSMQSIRRWLAANPEEGAEIMNTNASYVFFRELSGDGPKGGSGVELTPKRSLAIDRTLLSYGLPLWVDIAHPVRGQPNLQKLMIAQDTGGAIRGPVRGDVFWGHGKLAEQLAGQMKSKGRYWVLLPRGLDAKTGSKENEG